VKKIVRIGISSALLAAMLSCSPGQEDIVFQTYKGAVDSGERAIIPGSGTAVVETWLQNRADTRLVAGMKAHILYQGNLGLENVWLHYGVNGWQDVKTVPMARAELNTSAIQADFIVPLEARTLEFAFVLRDGRGESWDNNAGKDWNTDVFSAISDAQFYSDPTPHWRVTYIGRLISPMVHYGVKGWQGVKDLGMYKDGTIERNSGVTAYFLDIPSGPEDRLDWCFRDAMGNWDNNNGRDWRGLKAQVSAELWPNTTQGMLYYPDLIGKPVHSWLNGVYLGSTALILTHSGAYFSAMFYTLKAGDWQFVLDETVSGVRYYSEVKTRVDRVGLNISLPVVIKAL